MSHPNVRPLSSFLSKLAEKEINENPKTITRDLEALKLWISQNSYLRSRTDDQFLIAFLRGCKYSLERAKEKLESYYTFRSECEEFFSNRDPTNEKLCEIAELGTVIPLPDQLEDGSRIIIARTFNYDPNKLKFSDIMKYAFMVGDHLIMNDDNSIVSGVTVIVDIQGLSIAHAGQITPTYIKKISIAIQEAYPLRQKGLHFINVPSIFDAIFKIFQSFLSSKLKKRLFIHDSLESLHKHISKDLLPMEYGGEKIGDLQTHINYWRNEIQLKRDWFIEDAQYGIDETKCKNITSNNNNNKNDVNFGNSVDGSFRKLEID